MAVEERWPLWRFDCISKVADNPAVCSCKILYHMWSFSRFSKSHIDDVNHRNLKIYCGVGVSSTFLAVMRCPCSFFAVLRARYSEPPNAPL